MGFDLDDLEADGHESMQYQADGESPYGPPADVCKKCSDIPAGRLVPVSLCPVLAPLVKREYEVWLNGS